ncbi:MAG: glycerate kinase [Mongoliibacter sp.]|uniref:glycerate kinase n=1 Tax=Mongoliibacter sp. TaxID=2022438 RepID=UPI0012F10EC2|nr:glycerate kinase [Mongoliibacter sp.]TVP44482.1 MAG: glycerate kinase [Mongoliibacter sp.]
MNVLIAPNAFKGTIEAEDAAELIANAIKTNYPKAVLSLSPIADGGDGTCYLLGKSLRLKQYFKTCLDALGRPTKGYYFLTEDKRTAYLDVSTVSGIKDLKDYERNPWVSTTFGTGELILGAIENGATHIVLGLGGSATVDLGLGILGALGYVFLDKSGRQLSFFSDNFLKEVAHIQKPIKKYDVHFTFLCDVENTFYGEKGAVPVFGPQKGLLPVEIELFESLLTRLAKLFSEKTGKKIEDKDGFGAAGGIAFGLSFFFPIQIERGADWFFRQVGIDEKVKWADFILTGEGRYDAQSEGGKGSYELLQMAKKYGKKCVLITSGNEALDADFDRILILPELDFSNDNFQQIARQNLIETILNLDFKR